MSALIGADREKLDRSDEWATPTAAVLSPSSKPSSRWSSTKLAVVSVFFAESDFVSVFASELLASSFFDEESVSAFSRARFFVP